MLFRPFGASFITSKFFSIIFKKLLTFLSRFSAYQICLAVGETCGLPLANTVRPYRVLGDFSAKNIAPLGCAFF